VDTAKERCPDLPIQQQQLTDPLPLDDKCAQSVVLNQVIEHLDQETATRVLAEAHRVLRPNGRLLILSPSRRNYVERDADPTHVHLYLPSELDALLTAASFRVVRHLNAGFWFLPRSRAGMHLGRLALRVLPQDAFSATANVVAEPDHGEPHQ
jgi:SAM-dependent methyltransferase